MLLFAEAAAGSAAQRPRDGRFDYYVLALSWSPTYCASRPASERSLQCASVRHYAFVVHGLWPQYRTGWPQYCGAAGARVTPAQVADMLDIMPSADLVRHEWIKHGTCSGLAPAAYFALIRRLYEHIRIPARYRDPGTPIEVGVERLVSDFVGSNRGLAPAMISVQCGRRRDVARLAEVRVCFTRDGGAFAACGDNERRRCRAERVVLPPVR